MTNETTYKKKSGTELPTVEGKYATDLGELRYEPNFGWHIGNPHIEIQYWLCPVEAVDPVAFAKAFAEWLALEQWESDNGRNYIKYSSRLKAELRSQKHIDELIEIFKTNNLKG